MKALITYTGCGVADRVALALFGWKLAQTTGRAFSCLWPPGPGCACAFERLFVPRVPMHVILNLPRWPELHIQHGRLSQLVRQVGASRAEQVFVEGFFGHDYDAFDEVFGPSAEVAAAVERFKAAHFGGTMIGIHVRRGDKRRYDLPSDEQYFQALDHLLLTQPEVRFFLGTDDAAVEAAFSRRYRERLLTYPVRSLSRNSVQGIIDAVVVLYLLRSTSAIVSGIYSGYSLLAAWNKPITIIKKPTTPVSWDWEGRQLTLPATRKPEVMLVPAEQLYLAHCAQ